MADHSLVLELIIKAIGAAAAGAEIEGLDENLQNIVETLRKSGFSVASDDVRSFGDAVKDATDPMAAATAKALAFQTAITGLVTLLANRAYQASKSYESSLADLAKVLDDGVQGAKRYGKELDQTALDFAQNGEQLVGAMAGFKQGGFDAEEAFNLVNDAARLMIAGELDAAESSAYLTSILKGFKAPASEAAGLVDLLNEVSNEYATNVKELAVGMAGLSPIARQMGFSMAETAGLLTPAIEVYRSGSEAADALKTSLQQLANDTKPVKAALASIGVSQTDLNGQLRSGKDIFLDVARAMIGLTDAQKSYVTQQLVGIEQAGRFGTVINDLGKYLAVTDTALNSAGSAAKEVATRLDTAEASAARADESFRQLAVSLGNAFRPQIRGVVDATGELASAFDHAVKAGDLAPLLNVIKPQIAAIEDLLKAMAGNLEAALEGVDFRPLVDGLKAVSGEMGEAFAKLSEGMDLTTVEGLRALLQAIINLLGNFSQFVAGAVDGLQPLLGALNTLFAAVSQNSPALANLAGEIAGLATSANQIIPVVSQFSAAVFGGIGNVAELALKIGLLVAALKLLSAAGIPVIPILGRLAAGFLALNPAVASAITALAGFPGIITAAVAGVGALGYGIGTLVNRFVEWASGGQSVGSMLYDLVDAITGTTDAITRSATPEELAIARAQRLAREKEAQANATKEAAEAEEAARASSEALARAQEAKLLRNAEETETINRLTKSYADLGLIYDATTGKILRQGEATARQLQESRELGDALDKLGVSANYMSDRITAGGLEIISTFRNVTQNAQATAKQIEAAFKAAISSAETEAEVQKLLAAYQEWAAGAKAGAADVASATKLADDAIKGLKESTDEVSLAARLYAAAGVDALEIKRLEALAAGDLATALKIEEEQRKKNVDATKQQSEEEKRATAAAEAAKAAAESAEQAADAAKAAADQTQAASNAASSALQGWSDRLGALSDKARQAFDGYDESAQGAADSSQELADAVAGLATGGYVRWANEVAIRALEIEQRFNGQKESAQRLTEQLQSMADGGRVNMNALAEATRGVSGQFDLLDQQRLDNLQSAIDRAKASMDALRQASEDALLAAQEELLQKQGDEAGLLELQHKRQLLELQQQLNEARDAGDQTAIANLEKALAIRQRSYELEQQSIEAKNRSQNSSSGSSSATSSSASGGGGITVNVNASNARVLDNNFVDDLSRALQPKLANLARLRA